MAFGNAGGGVGAAPGADGDASEHEQLSAGEQVLPTPPAKLHAYAGIGEGRGGAPAVRRAAIFAIVSAALAGCALPVDDKSGVVNYLVLGFGIVSVSAPPAAASSSAVTYQT